MQIHFIAIGGAAMHNLALALHSKGYTVTGSDDEIFEPSKSRLQKAGILPEAFGWFPEKLNNNIDAVILGMHARVDNPELLKAQGLGLKIYSYPEFLYEQTKNKKRVVIGGSHGKTTITSMIMHVLKYHNISFDYMVGAQIEGFDTMVSLSEENELAVFEGDEYLSSPIDRRSKFHLYYPHIALLSGIGWDHINVFPTFELYLKQFETFINKIEPGGSLFYFSDDTNINALVKNNTRTDISFEPYQEHSYNIESGKTFLQTGKGTVPLNIFGGHNMQNLSGAKKVCGAIGVSEEMFYEAISSFSGSAKRLQELYSDNNKTIFLDFAHSPSKVKGTVEAVKEQFPDHELVAVLELHTFSSLKKEFLREYIGCLDGVPRPIVFYNPEVIKHKKLEDLTPEYVKGAFRNDAIEIVNTVGQVIEGVKKSIRKQKQVYLFMSSGNFGGLAQGDLINLIIT